MEILQALGGEVWSFCSDVIVLEDSTFIGDFEKFVVWAENSYKFVDYRYKATISVI